MNDKELLAKVREAYKQKKTKYIRKEELTKWLTENGLAPEEAQNAIHAAIKQSKIRFCYPSSVGKGELFPCYEKITKREEFPPEVEEETWKHIIRQDPRILLGVNSKTHNTNKESLKKRWP